MTDELTPERVRAALEYSASNRRYASGADLEDAIAFDETVTALARAHLANAAAPPASPWRPITPEVLEQARHTSLFVKSEEFGSMAFAWRWRPDKWLHDDSGNDLDFEPSHYIHLDEPPTEAGR